MPCLPEAEEVGVRDEGTGDRDRVAGAGRERVADDRRRLKAARARNRGRTASLIACASGRFAPSTDSGGASAGAA